MIALLIKMETISLKTKQTLDDNFKKKQLQVHPSIVPFITLFEIITNKLKAYVALVNHNVLNGSRVYHIIHILCGNYCHSHETQTSRLEDMGNDACIIVGYHDKVSSVRSVRKLFKTLIICCMKCKLTIFLILFLIQTKHEMDNENELMMNNLNPKELVKKDVS